MSTNNSNADDRLGAVEQSHDPLLDTLLALLMPRLTAEEGLRLKPYTDTMGKLTIGRGRNLDDVGIYLDEADLMTRNDIKRAIRFLDQHLSWWRTLSEARQIVLADMAFNMESKLLGFHHMIQALQGGDYGLAAQEMLDSEWAREVGGRAVELSRIMASGELK